MMTPRKKAPNRKYGDRSQQVNAKVTPQAKQGLEKLAQAAGVSVNEYLEQLGRGLITTSPPQLPGESLAS